MEVVMVSARTVSFPDHMALTSAFQVLSMHAGGVQRPYGVDPAEARRVVEEITGTKPPEGGPVEGSFAAGMRWLEGA